MTKKIKDVSTRLNINNAPKPTPKKEKLMDMGKPINMFPTSFRMRKGIYALLKKLTKRIKKDKRLGNFTIRKSEVFEMMVIYCSSIDPALLIDAYFKIDASSIEDEENDEDED